jgi:alpha,alpha-trehalase
LTYFDHIIPRGRESDLAVFLDYDGTLTPIFEDHDEAVLDAAMREIIQRLADCCKVAVISGRDLQDVQRRVALEQIFYAGSHGFEIAGPAGQHKENQEATALLPVLAEAERSLREQLNVVPGCKLERKRFSVAVHYRLVDREDDVDTVENAVDEVLEAYTKLRKTSGKKLYELQPDIGWDKGRAVEWLLDNLDVEPAKVLPLYLGDDITDEDAFWVLRERGIGIRVGKQEDQQRTTAQYWLRDQQEVGHFFEKFLSRLNRR